MDKFIKMKSFEEYFRTFKRQMNKTAMISFIVSFFSAVLCHLFFFTNFYANEDSLFSRVVDSQMIGSGRWMPGNLLSEFVSPGVLLLVVATILGIISYLITAMFEIKHNVYAVAIGLLFATFPVLSMFFGYNFMIERYMLGMLLSVLAAYFVDKRKFGFVLGGIFLAMSLGYYQSFITMSITISMIMVIRKIFDNNDFKENLLYICKYLGMGILGIAVYFFVIKVGYGVFDLELVSYKGINNMGSIPPISMWAKLIARTYGHIVTYLLGKQFLHPLGVSIVPQVLLTLLTLFLFILVLKKTKLKKANTILLSIIVILFPFGMNILDFLMYESHISTLNIYQFVFIFILPIILLNYAKSGGKPIKIFNLIEIISLVCLCLVVWSNFSLCNLYYTKLDDYNESTKLFTNRLVYDLEKRLGTNENFKVFFGNRTGIENGVATIYDKYILFDQGLWNRYIGYSVEAGYTDYKLHIIISNLMGKNYQSISLDERGKIMESVEYENMSVWPREGSVKYFDDVLVIKLS